MMDRLITRWDAMTSAVRRWRRDSEGTAVVEFALVLPMLLVVYVGGFETSQAVSVYRKLTDMTVQLANIASQDTSWGQTKLDSELAAATQIMSPFSTTDLDVSLVEVTTDDVTAGKGVVNASRGNNAGAPYTPYTKGTVLTTLPTTLAVKTTYIFVASKYNYNITVGAAIIKPIAPLQDQLFFLPRGVALIPCTDCA